MRFKRERPNNGTWRLIRAGLHWLHTPVLKNAMDKNTHAPRKMYGTYAIDAYFVRIISRDDTRHNHRRHA